MLKKLACYIIAGLFVSVLSVKAGMFYATDLLERQAIAHGFGTYVEESLDFKWNEPVYKMLPPMEGKKKR